MSYKDALITSKAGAVQLLKDAIAAAGVPNFEFQDDPSAEHLIAFKASVPGADAFNADPILNLYMGHRPQQHLCFLDAVGVADKYKGSGLGGATMKATLGIMHELSAHILLLRDVYRDGASYWPYYGAVPAKAPRTLSDEIQKMLDGADTKLDQNDRMIFEAAQSIAQTEPYHGWRALSQADALSTAGKAIRHKVFDHFAHSYVDGVKLNEAFVLFPAETSTRNILEQRLGRVPVFVRTTAVHPLEELLSKSPVIPAEVGPIREAGASHSSKALQHRGHG